MFEKGITRTYSQYFSHLPLSSYIPQVIALSDSAYVEVAVQVWLTPSNTEKFRRND
ncbi:hypothetical protein PIIN_10186 [Serendipita indica DSM 11827]|uniref:Uncharacterized protein n=1 Tax=Serendipita indica (strain DSM 11827) TaxID=1109443 RepID=G4TY00_SERID|nr:hypothetical protein PIIN_10186 [Serendipita indica DSM 11827]